MTYFFFGGIALLALVAIYQSLGRLQPRTRMRWLRQGAAGLAVLISVGLLLARRIDVAIFFAAAAYSIYRTGRLGRFSFESKDADESSISKVRSHYFDMVLDHSTSTVAGRARVGQFAGTDLMDLGEMETRALIDEIAWDPNSVSLLESWLDANRSGWREYFEQTAHQAAGASSASSDPVADAYAVLGLAAGASEADIVSAHRKLMKGVHPDMGGSSYLAAKINEARDLLLKQRR